MYTHLYLPLLLCALVPAGSGLIVEQRSVGGPVITQNFPDPCIIHDSNTWYAFATSSNGHNIPMATSSDFKKWELAKDDALPNAGNWSNGGGIWAPDVVQVEGGYAMFFAATDKTKKGRCIGVATSKSVKGPYEPTDSPLVCPEKQGGAIDPAGFRDHDGSLYVLWKVDGNSIGHGGNCGNGVNPIVPTPIMIQPLNPDGKAFKSGSSAKQLLDRDNNDGPLIEAPSLVRSSEGVYFLTFSSNCYSSQYYDVAYATATNVLGPFTKGPFLLKTGQPEPLYAPGGADITPDGTKMVFHADKGNTSHVRQMYAVNIKLSGHNIAVS